MNNIYRINGNKKNADSGTDKFVVLNTKSSVYNKYYTSLSDSDKKILMALMDYCDNDMNTIQVSGNVGEAIESKYNIKVKTVQNAFKRLYPLIEKTSLRGEYVINPLFAIKGNEDSVWRAYGKIELDKRDDFLT
mgnify:CR=1 FL=1